MFNIYLGEKKRKLKCCFETSLVPLLCCYWKDEGMAAFCLVDFNGGPIYNSRYIQMASDIQWFDLRFFDSTVV